MPITINGSVVDATDGQHIPYVNIVWEGTKRGTFTNELGDFLIKVDTLPITLVISHVGYDETEIQVVDSEKPVKVTLPPSMLQSVTITSKRADKNRDIIEKAYERTKEHTLNDHFGKAFYRQLSKNDSTHNELYEIFFDARFNADGINDWAIEQGRYALLEKTMGERFVFNKNFTLINRIFPTIHPNTYHYHSPVRSDALFFYDVEMTSSFVQADDREIAVMSFVPKPAIAKEKTPCMSGELYIDLKTYDILKVKGRFETNDLKIIKLRGDGQFENYILDYEIEFKPTEKGDLLIDYIKVRQTADVVYDNYKNRKLETNSLLTFYEYYEPKGRKNRRLGGHVRFRKSDKDRINKVEYDPVFWQENPIVKRTPVEEKVIATFERDRQFGSIYLNNKNEVAFLPELDNDPVIKVLTEGLAKNVPVHEKVYVHTDKPYYARGETLWFKAYITDAIVHRPYNVSKAMYVELINPLGQEVANKKLEVLGSGFAEGDFIIHPGYLSGTYQLRAYTDQMKRYNKDYFFKKEIDIHTGLSPDQTEAKAPDFDVQFFPEGGNLVYGIPSHLAFKAIDENGRPKAILGVIYDQDENEITHFETLHDGMGSFAFSPKKGQAYHAKITNGLLEKEVELIAPLENGYALSARNHPGKNLTVRVLCDTSLDNSTVYLIGSMRQYIYYKSKGTLKKQLLTFEVPKYILPNGVLHLTLMDSLHRPYCERLVFIDREDHLELTISPNKRKYNKQSEVELNLRLRDVFGDPIRAEMSVAVTDAGQIGLPKYGPNIKNQFLLTSDLKGPINDPEQYFDLTLPDTYRHLDLLMLTNGWRRFKWQQVLKKASSRPVPRTGFDVCGQLRPDDFEKYGRTVLTMIPLSNEAALYTATVDQQGRFCFANVNFQDTTKLAVQAIDDDGKYQEVSVLLDRSNNMPNDHFLPKIISPDGQVLSYLNNNEQVLQDQLYFDGQSISLDAVEVTAKKKEPTKGFRTFHGFADYTIKMDEKATNLIAALQSKVPFLNISYGNGVPQIIFTGKQNEPLILMDGVPLNPGLVSEAPINDTSNGERNPSLNFGQPSNHWGNGVHDVLSTYDPDDIERVEVLRGANASIYGTRGLNGVIAIYTKSEWGRKDPIITQTFEGYYTAREFYIPRYETKDRRDLRSTLFWSSSFQTDEKGRAKITFPNSDIAKSFNVVVEGITAEGQPVSEVLVYDWGK